MLLFVKQTAIINVSIMLVHIHAYQYASTVTLNNDVIYNEITTFYLHFFNEKCTDILDISVWQCMYAAVLQYSNKNIIIDLKLTGTI